LQSINCAFCEQSLAVHYQVQSAQLQSEEAEADVKGRRGGQSTDVACNEGNMKEWYREYEEYKDSRKILYLIFYSCLLSFSHKSSNAMCAAMKNVLLILICHRPEL
jgi:hypothetical protein